MKLSIDYCSLTWFRVLLLNQNRNAACGIHKEEMLYQLRQLGKLKSELNYENADAEPIIRFKSAVPDQNLQPANIYTGSGQDAEPISYPASEVKSCFIFVILKLITCSSRM